MKNFLIVMFLTAFIGSLSTACTTREGSGALAGAAVGGTLGSAFGGRGGALFGALTGAAIGASIGRNLDREDRRRTSLALEQNKTNQSTTWVNPDTNNQYTVTPTRTYASGSGPCREFTMDAQIGGKTEQVYGTACRQQDGSWKVVK